MFLRNETYGGDLKVTKGGGGDGEWTRDTT